jgi:hypothetical protein
LAQPYNTSLGLAPAGPVLSAAGSFSGDWVKARAVKSPTPVVKKVEAPRVFYAPVKKVEPAKKVVVRKKTR